MRIFTKSFVMMLFCMLGVMSANAKVEQVHATFEQPSNTNTTWNPETRSFTWSTTYYNQLRNIGLPNGDITKYKKLVVDCKMVTGDQFRILFYKGGSNLTLYAKDGVNEFIIKDALEAVAPNDYNEYLLACDEICLSGDNGTAPGEAIINDVYLETYNDEGEKVFATFENPSNTNTTWNGETKSFTWSTTYYNQLRNIGLPNGDISKYKKLVVDCKMVTGDQFRILFYKGGSNLTLYAKDGVNEFIIKDALEAVAPNDYNEYLLACDEICLSGDNVTAPGEAIINQVYLETYPENEVVEVPEIVYEEDPGIPEGDFIDFTEVFPNLQPRIGLGDDGHPIVLGNGEVIVGQRSQQVIADLSGYSKLTMVTSPNLKLVLYMNHEVAAQQNAGDYAEEDAGKYVFLNVQADEKGLVEIDLTQFDKQDLNCICLPWDNNNKGTVWYLLLTQGEAIDPVELCEMTPAPGLYDALPTEWVITYGGKKLSVKEDADVMLSSGDIEYPLYIMLDEEDDTKVIVSFDGKPITTPGEWMIWIPENTISIEGTPIADPQSFKFTVKNPIDYTIDPEEGEVESLDAFIITFNNYKIELNEEEAGAMLINLDTEEEVWAMTVTDIIGEALYIELPKEVTEPGTYQLVVMDATVKNLSTDEFLPELAFNYTIAKPQAKEPLYALNVDDKFTSGQTVEVKDGDEVVATITYGEAGGNDFNAAVEYTELAGYPAYTTGNGTNGNKEGGTFYTIVPKYDGKISVAVVLNADKSFYIEEDGTPLADYNGITVSEKYYGTFDFSAKAGSSYKIYCAGSKLGFFGFDYNYQTTVGISGIQTVAPSDGIIYTLSGQKVETMKKGGIYIINGKKVIR